MSATDFQWLTRSPRLRQAGSTMFGTGGRSTAAPVEHTHGPCVRVAASELPEMLRRDHAHGAVAVAVAVAVE
jgi:hypothetical protein